MKLASIIWRVYQVQHYRQRELRAWRSTRRVCNPQSFYKTGGKKKTKQLHRLVTNTKVFETFDFRSWSIVVVSVTESDRIGRYPDIYLENAVKPSSLLTDPQQQWQKWGGHLKVFCGRHYHYHYHYHYHGSCSHFSCVSFTLRLTNHADHVCPSVHTDNRKTAGRIPVLFYIQTFRGQLMRDLNFHLSRTMLTTNFHENLHAFIVHHAQTFYVRAQFLSHFGPIRNVG